MLLLPIVQAQEEFSENFQSYENLDLNLSMSSKIDLNYLRSSSRIDYLIMDLSFFPRESYRQSVLDLNINSEPSAVVSEDEQIICKWDKPKEGEVKFDLKSTIRTENEFKKITKKINFPILSLDNRYLEYTKGREYTDITVDIKNKANEIVEGEMDLYKAVYRLAEWTKSNIKYDLNTLTAKVVQKSSWVLKNKEGVCDEITNLFISFCRSVGIPARFVYGVAYSNLDKKFGNHGWAEVYFPGYGWVPFDVTYGQYGYLDATHIKLMDNYDSGTSSVEYTWKSKYVEVETGDLKIETNLIKEGRKRELPISISVKPLKKRVSFGSYVPIKVTVKNSLPYYVPLQVYITKAPGLLEKNVKQMLLEPEQIKNIYWIVEIPSNLNENYIYSSVIEVKSVFGGLDSATVDYAKGYEYYSLGEANSKVDELSEKEEKVYFPNLDLECSLDKEDYYSNEIAKVVCVLINKGNLNLKNVKVCLKEDCKEIDLAIVEKKELDFDLGLEKSEEVIISAENEDMIKYGYLDVKVIILPRVSITDLKPEKVSYGEKVNLSFVLKTNTEIKDVKIKIKNVGIVEIARFDGSRELSIPVKGSSLIEKLNFHLSYKDEKGKLYSKDKEFSVEVENIPFYAKIWDWFLNLF